MKKEYDFSKAERGKFYRKNADVRLPIYLGARLQKQVESLASRTGRGMREHRSVALQGRNRNA